MHPYQLLVAAVSMTALLTSGCAHLPATRNKPPSADLQAAMTYIQSGESDAALPILSTLANSDAPTIELMRARVLTALLLIEQGDTAAAQAVVDQISSAENVDSRLYEHALELAIRLANEKRNCLDNLAICERSNDRLRDDKRALEGTVKKLRKLSLE